MTVSKASLSKIQYTTPITDVPDAPIIGTATNVGTSRAYNDGAATVTYTAAATGGTADSFTATSSPGSFTATGSSPITVTGLQSDTNYTFTLTSTNTAATSAQSQATSSITATTVPQAPTIGTASVGSATTAVVPYTLNATGGSAITSISVVSSPSIALTYTDTDLDGSVTVTGTFAAATTYSFTVAAINANGTSSASSASNGIIPNPAPTVSGGTLTSDATYYYRTFTGSGNLVVSNNNVSMTQLVVGGGGGGGNSCGGGGGGGGLTEQTTSISPGTYAIAVGGGGGNASAGSGSSFFVISSETDDEATNYVSHWEVVAQDQGGKWIRDPPLPQSVTGAETLIALIDILCEHPIASELFDRPVSLKDCPNYTDSGGIAQPMDLTLIRARLLSGYYRSLDSVLSDVDLIARNAHIYNDEELSSIPVFCGSGVLCYEPAHRAIAASELG